MNKLNHVTLSAFVCACMCISLCLSACLLAYPCIGTLPCYNRQREKTFDFKQDEPTFPHHVCTPT